MKKLPPLKSETRALLNAAHPSWGEGLRKSTQARTDADIYPPLADFLSDLDHAFQWEAGNPEVHGGDERFKPFDSLENMQQFMGMLCAVAQSCGDVAFFKQVAFLVSTAKTRCTKNCDILTAYRFAHRIAKKKEGATALPAASEVAAVFDSIAGREKGSTPAATIKDLCGRQAVKLPLADGKRGPQKARPDK